MEEQGGEADGKATVGTGFAARSAIDAGQALGQKNTAFAIWIAYTYLDPLSSVGPGCYILWQNIVNSIELWDKRKKDEQKAKSSAEIK